MSGLREKDRDGSGTDAGVPRVLVVWCPDWPVVATDPEAGPAGPVAVVDGGKVLACSNAARTAGVRRGQRLRLAQRLCPELTLRERDVEAEIRRFEPVVAAVEAFTPRVEVLRPGLCAIPVKGPSRYFGGEEALAARVHAAVAAALARSLREPPPAAGPDGPPSPRTPRSSCSTRAPTESATATEPRRSTRRRSRSSRLPPPTAVRTPPPRRAGRT